MVEIQLPAIIPTSFWPPAQWRGVKMHVAVLVNFVSWSWLTAELVLGVETGCCMARESQVSRSVTIAMSYLRNLYIGTI